MFSPPPMPAAPPPPVFAQAAQPKPQKKGPVQPTIVGSAPQPGQMGSSTLLGQTG